MRKVAAACMTMIVSGLRMTTTGEAIASVVESYIGCWSYVFLESVKEKVVYSSGLFVKDM
jgi:hypothetical protein